jgi:hypothetical protein
LAVIESNRKVFFTETFLFLPGARLSAAQIQSALPLGKKLLGANIGKQA